MRKTIILIIGLLSLLYIWKNNSLSANQNDQTVKMGYCPTMGEFLEDVDMTNTQLLEYEFSAQVLAAFNAGVVDIALVGRKARPGEVSRDAKQVQINSLAKTLVTKTYKEIPVSELAENIIFTDIKTDPSDTFYENLKISHKGERKSLTEDSDNEIKLVFWKDVDYGQHDLLVPVDEAGRKVSAFRTPFIYYSDEFLADQVLQNVRK